VTGVFSDAPQTFGGLRLIRTTVKGTVNHYEPGLLGADHQWRSGLRSRGASTSCPRSFGGVVRPSASAEVRVAAQVKGAISSRRNSVGSKETSLILRIERDEGPASTLPPLRRTSRSPRLFQS